MQFYSKSSAGKYKFAAFNKSRVKQTLALNTQYSVGIRSSVVINDAEKRNLDDHLYIMPKAWSLFDREQKITTPAISGEVIVEWYKYKNFGALSYWANMKSIIIGNRAKNLVINYDTVNTFGTNPIPGADNIPYYDIVFGNTDDEMYAIPYDAPQAGLVNLTDSTLTLFGTINEQRNKYKTGIFLPNHSICYIPCNPGNVLIYSIKDELEQTFSAPFGWNSGILLPDGRIFCCAYSEDSIFSMIDFIENGITHIGTKDAALDRWYSSCVLLEDGTICAIPELASQPLLINPYRLNNPFSYFEPPDPIIPQNYTSGLLMTDGQVLAIPGTATQPALINTTAKTVTKFGVELDYGNAVSSLLLPDGRIFVAANNKPHPFIIDPVNKTTTELTTVGMPDGSNMNCLRGKLLPDGRLIFATNNSQCFTVISASDGNYGLIPDIFTCKSSYLNHS